MWKPTNFIEALLPIFILSVTLCHGVIQFPRLSKSKVHYTFLYSIFTTVVFFVCFIFVYVKYFEDYWLDGMLILYFFNTTVINLVMLTNIVVGWIYKNKSLIINSRLITADQTLKELGIPIDAHKEFAFIIKIVVFWIVYTLFINILRTIESSHLTNFPTQLIITFTIHHGYHVNFLIDLTFSLFIKHMRIRFKSINELLQDILLLQDNNLTHQIKTDYKWAISRKVNFEKDYTTILRDIKSIHIHLGIMCRELTKIYGIPITLTMLTSFANITSMLVVTYTIAISDDEEILEKIMLLLTLIPWTVVFSFKFFIINYVCAETVIEWKKTGEIIHLLELKTKDLRLRTEIQLFSIQILQNPLKFSPCGLFDLGYYFMKDFAGAVSSQVILSIQTYRSPTQKNL